MNILADNKEFLKHTEIWNEIKSLFNKKFNKKGLYNRPVYNNKYIRTKISPYNDVFKDNKKIRKDKYYGHSILLIESICEVENKHYPQTFLDNFFECSSIKTHNDNNKNSFFKKLVQIIDWSDDESNN